MLPPDKTSAFFVVLSRLSRAPRA